MMKSQMLLGLDILYHGFELVDAARFDIELVERHPKRQVLVGALLNDERVRIGRRVVSGRRSGRLNLEVARHVGLDVVERELEGRAEVVRVEADVDDELRLVHGDLESHVREPLRVVLVTHLVRSACQYRYSIA